MSIGATTTTAMTMTKEKSTTSPRQINKIKCANLYVYMKHWPCDINWITNCLFVSSHTRKIDLNCKVNEWYDYFIHDFKRLSGADKLTYIISANKLSSIHLWPFIGMPFRVFECVCFNFCFMAFIVCSSVFFSLRSQLEIVMICKYPLGLCAL